MAARAVLSYFMPMPVLARSPGLAIVAWCAGVGAVQALPALPPVAALVAALAGFLALASLVPRARVAAGLAALALAGVTCATLRASARMADALPEALEGEDVEVIGVVDDLPRVVDRGVRFAFATEGVLTPGASVPARLALGWFVGFPDAERGVPPPLVHAGERWRLTVRLQRPHGLANAAGFDLEAWLLERNLRATGYVRGDDGNMRLDAFAGRAMDVVNRARERVRERVRRALPGAAYAGVLVALAIGDQSGLDDAHWSVFNRTGTGHLISVSGLHVTVFALLAGGVAYALLRRCVALTTHVPARKLAAVAGLAASAGYVLLAGAEVPALRTLAMLAVATLGLWLARPGTAFSTWLAALALVLAFDPWAVLGPGFWLSFFAVGVLIFAGAGRVTEAEPARTRVARLRATLAEATRSQAAITLGLAPLSLLLFGQLSIVGPLANAISIPVVTFVIVPVVLVAALVPPLPLWPLAHDLVALLMRVLEPFAAWPGAAWAQHRPLPLAVAFAVPGLLLALAPRGAPGRPLGIVLLLPLVLLVPPRPPPGTFRLTVLDVGQGTAAIIETHAHTLLYDTGPRWNDAADAGGRVIAPVLRAAGIRKLDTLVVSHRDLDHAGGALSVLQQVPVALLLSSLDEAHPIVLRQRERGATQRCTEDTSWTWDGVRFDVLFPEPRHYADATRKPNDLSCVLRVAGVHGSALLAGDIEAVSELALLLARREALAADILLAPHHGSRTSSTPAFVAAVGARHVVFTVGHRNRFGHPRADVVARYVRAGSQLHRTDRSGALTFVAAAPGPGPPVAQRDHRRRYWHALP